MTGSTLDSGPRPRRVVIASELMYPELTSTGYYVSAIARELAGTRPVTVLCGQPTYAARGMRAPRRDTWEGVDIRRCWGTTFDKNRIPGRLANMTTLGISAFLAALRGLRRGDLVLVVTNPPVLPALVAVACRLRGATYVPVIHDHYPDLLVAAAGLSEGSILVRVLRAANRTLFRGAARVVVVGRDMKARFARHYPDVKTPVDVCPNWAEADRVSPADRRDNALLADLRLTER
ncbi:MAG: glycosyltransferase, partial [Vicinamibacterales bacterium]